MASKIFIITITIVSTLLISFTTIVESKCIERERQALLKFKQGLSVKPNYESTMTWLSSWGDHRDCCLWEGIRCNNGSGHVVGLDLRSPDDDDFMFGPRGNNIISPSLIELSHLEYLDLSYFNGPIPSYLGNLSSLKHLDLSHNSDDDFSDMKWLSGLPSLEYLDFSQTQIRDVDWLKIISGLTKLSSLRLTACFPPLTKLITNGSKSPSLTFVDLGNNFLPSSILQWLFNSSSVKSLVSLDLSANKLKGSVPGFFGSLCALKSLNLYGNELGGGLDFLRNLSKCVRPSLESLDMGMNLFSGQIPDFSVFSFLRKLDLYANRELTGNLTESIKNLPELEFLRVSFPRLDGVVSETFLSNFSKLTTLDLSYTSIALKFTDLDWTPPFKLNYLDLSHCRLEGSLSFPNWLRNQNSISYLDLSHLGIVSNSIPIWFWNLTSNIKFFDLSSNKIHGVLPSHLPRFKSFSAIYLGTNLFEGNLPSVHSNVGVLDLSGNNLSGSILPLCNISHPIGILDLSNNRLSGGIPSHCPPNWPFLRVLNLARNNLSGEIPTSIGSLLSLKTLDLTSNEFSGELLSSSLKNCEELEFLSLGENKLSGSVPSWIGESLLRLKILILSSNNLSSDLPRKLCQLSSLLILDLSNNKISGTIPQCLGNFTAMTNEYDQNNYQSSGYEILAVFYYDPDGSNLDTWSYIDKAMVTWKGRSDEYRMSLSLLRIIDLSNNQFFGEFPSGVLNLSRLVALNLSGNFLSGLIPQNINRLERLESLDMSRNRFSGEIPANITELHFLSHLDLSHNMLRGKIPSGTQIRGFDKSVFFGNPALCGPPISEDCLDDRRDHDSPSTEKKNGDRDVLEKWFFVGVWSGFLAGFWGFCGVLLFSRDLRYVYLLFLNRVVDWVLVGFEIQMAKLL